MKFTQDDVVSILKESGALLSGHFILRSGLRSAHFFQCARVCEQLDKVTKLASALLQKLEKIEFETILAPAMGGLVIGQEVARQVNKRYIFAEKNNDILVIRRGFTLKPGEKVLIVEDVITKGGRVNESINLVRKAGGEVAAVSVLVDRSGGKTKFDVPLVSLLELNFPTYRSDNLPEALKSIPPIKPGS